MNILAPYSIQPNITNKRSKKVSNTNIDNNSRCEHDLKRPQMTSSDLVKPDTIRESIIKCRSNKRNKNILMAGSMHENIDINDKILNEIVHNINI